MRGCRWPWLTEHVKIWADAFVQWVSDSWPGWVAAAQQLLLQLVDLVLQRGERDPLRVRSGRHPGDAQLVQTRQ